MIYANGTFFCETISNEKERKEALQNKQFKYYDFPFLKHDAAAVPLSKRHLLLFQKSRLLLCGVQQNGKFGKKELAELYGAQSYSPLLRV